MRSMWTIVLATAVTAVILNLPIHGQQSAPAPRDTSPRVLDVQGGKIRVTTVATGLFHPWSMAFIDARTLLVAERNGKLRIIRDGVLSPAPVWTTATTGRGNDALHAIALHPKFAENGMVYMSYPKSGER
jgi:glucose/arabinose dehydrogenase